MARARFMPAEASLPRAAAEKRFLATGQPRTEQIASDEKIEARVLPGGVMMQLIREVAARRGQEVIYLTERAVFRLRGGRVHLTEVAPGVDLKADILDRMGFAPVVAPSREVMDHGCFTA